MINVVHAFTGVDAQYMAEKKVWGKANINVVGSMEIDVDAIISCALIHENEKFHKHMEKEWNNEDYDNAREWLRKRNIGFDFKTNKSKLDRMKKEKLKQLYVASVCIKNYGDISLANKVKLKDEIDLFTYSFPCQDISVAGKQEGLSKGSGTRSGLLWECEQFIVNNKPKVLVMENVKNLVGKKFINEFNSWLGVLDELGYKSYWKVLNSKDFGIPQNRERVFCVSIRNDIDCEYIFNTPTYQICCIKDILESNVDKKYYLSDSIQNRFVFKPIGDNIVGTTAPNKPIGQRDLVYNPNKIMGSPVATDYKQPKQVLEVINPLKDRTTYGWHFEQQVYDVDGIARTVKAGGGSGNIPKVICEQRSDEGLRFFKDNICGTLRTIDSCGDKRVLEIPNFKIRKLTPRECWRLMGFSDEDFDKVKDHISDSQLYKQAGNSIVVNCLEAIFNNLKGIIG